MFTGRYEPIPGSGQVVTPTTSQTMTSSFKSGFAEPFLITPGMEADKRKYLADKVADLNEESQVGNPGYIHKGANWLAGMAGSILNPYSLAAGELGGAIAKPIISRGAGLVGRYLPSEASAFIQKPLEETLSKNLPEFVAKESIGSLASKGVSGFSQATGFSLPGDLANTYDPKTDAFNWFGGIKAATADGGFGLALMSAPYLAGTLWSKLFKDGAADHATMPLPGEGGISEDHIDQSVSEKRLTPEQGQWFKDYAAKTDTNENLSKRATSLLIKDGHPVDSSTNQVMFKILHPDDVSNYQIAVSDSLASNLPDNMKHLYSDFIGHARMDDLRENPSVIDGIKGVVSFVNQRLEKAPEEIETFKKQINESLPKDISHESEGSFLSQKNIFKTVKKMSYEESHIQSLPVSIPENIKRRVTIQAKINKLKAKAKQEAQPLDRKTYHRGRSSNTFGYKSLQEAGVTEESLMKNDLWLGKGYWYADNDLHAKKYGNVVETVKGKFKIFDVEKDKDSKLIKLYNDIKQSNRLDLIPDESGENKKVKEFRAALKSKGYDGIRRFGIVGKDAGEYETMFFKKPKDSKIEYQSNKQTLRRIEELEEKLPEILTMKREVEHLRSKLMPEGKAKENFKAMPEYQRLLDLTRVRNDARALFHEIHLRHEYELHEAYATVLDTITKVMRSEFGKFAKPENINDYMRERIQAANPQFKDLEVDAVKKEVAESKAKLDKASEATKTPEGRDKVVQALDEEIKESGNKETTKEYDEIKNQMDEFKDNESVFSALIKCVIGATNG